MVYAVYLANLLRPKVKFATVIGSYGWKGSIVDQIVNLIPKLKVELLNPVIIRGKPRDEDFALLDNLIDEIVQKHEELGLFRKDSTLRDEPGDSTSIRDEKQNNNSDKERFIIEWDEDEKETSDSIPEKKKKRRKKNN